MFLKTITLYCITRCMNTSKLCVNCLDIFNLKSFIKIRFSSVDNEIQDTIVILDITITVFCEFFKIFLN